MTKKILAALIGAVIAVLVFASAAAAVWHDMGYGAVGVQCKHYYTSRTTCDIAAYDWYDESPWDKPVTVQYKRKSDNRWHTALHSYNPYGVSTSVGFNHPDKPTKWRACRSNVNCRYFDVPITP